MIDLESEIVRKYIKTKDASDWEIETDKGWEDLSCVSKTEAYEVFKLKTKTRILKCADNHIVFVDGHEQIFVKDLKQGDKIITEDGPEEVESVESLGYEEEMYDLDIDNEDKRYYSNGILSHNSTITGLYCLWYAMFSVDPVNIFILANKAKSSQGLLDDIKVAYEEIEPYLKRGIVEYNKLSITFDNRSKIVTGATTKDSLRGESVSLLLLDEFAHVPPHIAEEFYQAVAPTISCLTGDTLILTRNGFEKIENYKPEGSDIGDYIEIDNLEVYGQKGIEKASHFYNSPNSETKIITTKYGFRVETTLEHPLKVNDANGFDMKKTKNIEIGEQLQIYNNMNVYGEEDKKPLVFYYTKPKTLKKERVELNGIDSDFAYMIGGYLAEGWCGSGESRCKFVNISNTEIEFQQVFLNDGFKFQGKRTDRLRGNSYHFSKFKTVLGDMYDKKCHEKEIPEIILKSSEETQKHVISGYIDGDGCVNKDGSIEIISTSRKMLSQVQMMMLNMGIVTRLTKKEIDKDRLIGKYVLPQGTVLKSLRDVYGLIIPRGYSTRIREEFNLRITRKRERLLKTYNRPQDNEKQKKIIFTQWMIDEINHIMSQNIINDCQLRYKYGVRRERWKVGNSIKIETFRKFIEAFKPHCDTQKGFNLLKEMAEEDCLFDEIVSIEDSTSVTYDLTCPETHTFLQNGILGSNTGGKMVIISTPNGNSGVFYDIYAEAEKGENGFQAFGIDWREVPRFDDKGNRLTPEEFRDQIIKATSLQSWKQEHECSFLGSARTLITSPVLERFGKMVNEINHYEEYGNWVCYEKPKQNHIYVMGADVAKGTERDYSTIQILDITNKQVYKQVATYKNNTVDPFDFADEIHRLGKLYNDAYVIVENNTYGHEVNRRLFKDLEYENLYKERKKKDYGVTAGLRSKGIATTRLKKYAEENRLILRDKGTYKELCNFIEQRPDIYACPEGHQYHDDLVMGLAWACYFIGSDYWYEWEDYIRKELLGKDDRADINNDKEMFEPFMFEEFSDRRGKDSYFGDDLMW
jgi:intein/homing endonuclease